MMQQFYVLMVGNSRFHWATIQSGEVQRVWHCPHTDPLPFLDDPLVFASVVPDQGDRLKAFYPEAREMTLADLPLKNLYPTLGIDRALAIYGAGELFDYPALVIDGGTALTLSGVDSDRRFVGGAILPGLKLQFQTLAQGTAALPDVTLPLQLPEPWATNTEAAIASGILWTIIVGLSHFIDDWLATYPTSQILITGGDGAYLQQHLAKHFTIHHAPNLVLQGLGQLTV